MAWESPLSGSRQVSYLWGRWEAEMDWELVQHTEALPLIAFLNKYGDGDIFTVYDPARTTPMGEALGEWTTNSAINGKVHLGSQTGRTIETRWPTSYATKTILKAGDLFTIKDVFQMFEVVEDCVAGAATQDQGQIDLYGAHCRASIKVGQRIRTSPADGDYIVVQYAPVKMMLTEPPSISVSDYLTYSVNAKMVEYLGVP